MQRRKFSHEFKPDTVTASCQVSILRSESRSFMFRHDNGNRTCISTARRMATGKDLK